MAYTQAGGIFGQRVQGQDGLVSLTDGVRAKQATGPVSLLLVDGDEHIREDCRTVGGECRTNVFGVGTPEEALEVMELSPVDILPTDLWLPGTSGLELLKKVCVAFPDVAVVMLGQGVAAGSAKKCRTRRLNSLGS